MTDQTITFHPAEIDPVGNELEHATYLLYNQCDGYHIVYADFDGDVFEGFRDWLGTSHYDSSFYAAWAKLPDCNAALFPIFGRTHALAPKE